jgi:hypothetical protein
MPREIHKAAGGKTTLYKDLHNVRNEDPDLGIHATRCPTKDKAICIQDALFDDKNGLVTILILKET